MEKITQLVFEELNVPSLFFGVKNILGLYSAGRASGLSVHSGFSGTEIGFYLKFLFLFSQYNSNFFSKKFPYLKDTPFVLLR